jgi:hypothetical protein
MLEFLDINILFFEIEEAWILVATGVCVLIIIGIVNFPWPNREEKKEDKKSDKSKVEEPKTDIFNA